MRACSGWCLPARPSASWSLPRPLLPAPTTPWPQHPTPAAAGMWLALLCITGALACMAAALRRLYATFHAYGSAPPLVYAAFFLPTSINTAWLSVAAAVQLLIALLANAHRHLEGLSALAAAAATAGGAYVLVQHRDTAYGAVWGGQGGVCVEGGWAWCAGLRAGRACGGGRQAGHGPAQGARPHRPRLPPHSPLAGLTLVWALVAVFEKTASKLVAHTAVAAILALLALMCVCAAESGGGSKGGAAGARAGWLDVEWWCLFAGLLVGRRPTCARAAANPNPPCSPPPPRAQPMVCAAAPPRRAASGGGGTAAAA